MKPAEVARRASDECRAIRSAAERLKNLAAIAHDNGHLITSRELAKAAADAFAAASDGQLAARREPV